MFLLTACLLFFVLVFGTSISDASDNASDVAPRLFLDMESGMSVLGGHKIQTGVSIKRPAVSSVYGTMFIPTSTIIISGINPLTYGYVDPFFPIGNTGNEESVLIKISASSALRDNLVTVFGHLLFQGKWPDDTHTYSALMLLYSNLRHRQISTIDLLPVLSEVSVASPSGQMLILLNKLAKIVPRYLKSAVEEVIMSATKNQRLIDNLMRPDGGPLVIDFLAGIDGYNMMTLFKPIELGSMNEVKEVSHLLGHTFSQILTSIFNGNLKLTQALFAGILSHLPVNHLNPRGEEYMRVFIEYLKVKEINNWSVMVGVNNINRKKPYGFVQRTVISISTSTDVSETIREAASYIVDYLQEPEVAFSNPYFDILSPIISKPSIDFPSLLQSITYPEFPADVVDVKNRIVYYIQHGYLDIDLVTKGFMRYDHVKPVDLVIAILTRITTTMPNLPTEIMSSVKSLTVHLIFKEFSCTMASTIPSDLVDLYFLTVAFKSPSLPPYFVTAVEQVIIPIIKALPHELRTILSQMPLYLCTQPRTCLINVFMRVKVVYPLKIQPFLYMLEPFLQFSLTILEVPLPPFIMETVNPGPPFIINVTDVWPPGIPILPPIIGPEIPEIPVFPPIPTQKPPTKPTPSVPLPPIPLPPIPLPPLPPPLPPTENITGEVTLPSIEAIIRSEEIWSILVRIPAPTPDIWFPLPSPIQEGLPVPPGITIVQLLPAPMPGTPEFELLRPIRLILSIPLVTKYIYQFIKVTDYNTRGELLRAVLNFVLKMRIIQELPGFSAYIKAYIYQLNLSKDTNPLQIYWSGLLVALPLPQTQIEIKYFEIIRTFLQGNVSSFIGQSFNVKQYRVKGQLLKALLKFLLTLPQIKKNQELFACIQYYVERVLLHGYGAQPIEYIIGVRNETKSAVVDLTSVFSALNSNRFDSNAKNAYNNVVKYFSQGNVFQGFNFSLYKKKGPFLKALFEFIIAKKDTTNEIRKYFKTLIPYISMTGPGEEPVEYK